MGQNAPCSTRCDRCRRCWSPTNPNPARVLEHGHVRVSSDGPLARLVEAHGDAPRRPGGVDSARESGAVAQIDRRAADVVDLHRARHGLPPGVDRDNSSVRPSRAPGGGHSLEENAGSLRQLHAGEVNDRGRVRHEEQRPCKGREGSARLGEPALSRLGHLRRSSGKPSRRG